MKRISRFLPISSALLFGLACALPAMRMMGGVAYGWQAAYFALIASIESPLAVIATIGNLGLIATLLLTISTPHHINRRARFILRLAAVCAAGGIWFLFVPLIWRSHNDLLAGACFWGISPLPIFVYALLPMTPSPSRGFEVLSVAEVAPPTNT